MTGAPPVKKKLKLSYMDQREWDGLEVKIHEAEVDRLYQRWAELEGKLKN